jgi:hypothetical protein
MKLGISVSNEDLLKQWFTYKDFTYDKSPSYNHVYESYRRLTCNYPHNTFEILCTESFLRLFTWLSFEKDIPERVDVMDASLNLPLFQLYMLFNDEVNKCYDTAARSVAHFKDDRNVQRTTLAISFPQYDFIEADFLQITTSQFYKAMKLLVFLETSVDYAALYKKFLLEFECENKADYLKNMGPVIMPALAKTTPGWTILNIQPGEKFQKDSRFLEKLSVEIDDDTLVEQNDYLKLRSNPLQKMSKGSYRVIFDLFLIKKLYNGLFFKLSEIDRKNKLQHKENGVEILFPKNFLGQLRSEFSEAALVYNLMDEIFESQNFTRITGNQFKKAGLNREPDYYMRMTNSILLFESKDFFIPGEIKLSYDFNRIEEELKKGRLGKAVIQIGENISRTIKKELILDDAYEVTEIKIYPIIIVS